MGTLLKWSIWLFLFVMMVLTVDQLLVRISPLNPTHETISQFYRDFRTRMLLLAIGKNERRQGSVTNESASKPQPSIEAIIGEQQAIPTARSMPDGQQRYIYSDADGTLQFSDSLKEVPERYRSDAEPIGR